MINSKELRLLNLVKRGVNELEVNELEDYGIHGKPTINGWEEEDIDPIKLSAEWLDRFGFSKEEKYAQRTDVDKYYVHTLNEFTYNSIHGWWYNGQHLRLQPQYVHQLMNLFYFLTGEELIIKQ